MQLDTIHFNQAPSGESSEGQEKLPFTLQDLKAAIPAECFQPSVTKSLYYFRVFYTTICALSSRHEQN